MTSGKSGEERKISNNHIIEILKERNIQFRRDFGNLMCFSSTLVAVCMNLNYYHSVKLFSRNDPRTYRLQQEFWCFVRPTDPQIWRDTMVLSPYHILVKTELF